MKASSSPANPRFQRPLSVSRARSIQRSRRSLRFKTLHHTCSKSSTSSSVLPSIPCQSHQISWHAGSISYCSCCEPPRGSQEWFVDKRRVTKYYGINRWDAFDQQHSCPSLPLHEKNYSNGPKSHWPFCTVLWS